jgi:hypothetical protein
MVQCRPSGQDEIVAGANLQDANPDTLCLAVHRLIEMLSLEQRQQIMQHIEIAP